MISWKKPSNIKKFTNLPRKFVRRENVGSNGFQLDKPNPTLVILCLKDHLEFGHELFHSAKCMQNRFPLIQVWSKRRTQSKRYQRKDSNKYLKHMIEVELEKLFRIWCQRSLIWNPFVKLVLAACGELCLQYRPLFVLTVQSYHQILQSVDLQSLRSFWNWIQPFHSLQKSIATISDMWLLSKNLLNDRCKWDIFIRIGTI